MKQLLALTLLLSLTALQPALAQENATVYSVAQEQPEPEGGMQAFYEYVSTSMNMPVQAAHAEVQGKVLVQFVVDKEGRLTNAQVIRGLGHGCDEEALRIIQEAPQWKPGTQGGQPVNVRMILPISFRKMNS